jgi:hypothetical protein
MPRARPEVATAIDPELSYSVPSPALSSPEITANTDSTHDEDGGRARRQGPSQALRRGAVRQGTTPPPTPHLHHLHGDHLRHVVREHLKLDLIPMIE